MSVLPPGYRHVPITRDRVPAVLEFDRLAWAMPLDDDQGRPPFPVPLDRAWSVEAPDGSLAAIHGSFPFAVPVPGGQVRGAGLTWVAVNPGHRRRGLLRAMMDEHLTRTVARGEVVSVLKASEEPIYTRFGFGRAADQLIGTLERGAALRPVPGSEVLDVTFTTASNDDADLVDAIHQAAGRGRPGWLGRDLPELKLWVMADVPGLRGGAEPLRLVVVRASDGTPRAYALVRRTPAWPADTAAFTVKVTDAAAVDAAACHRLWSFLLDLDLTVSVETPPLACDDPLWHLLVNRRAAQPRLADSLWLRLVDLPAALAARRCGAPVDIVVDVTDTLIASNHGRWHLRSDGPHAPTSVAPTDQPADITMDVRDLSSVYLGAPHLVALADAGLVTEHTPGALVRAAAALTWHTVPFCSWEF